VLHGVIKDRAGALLYVISGDGVWTVRCSKMVAKDPTEWNRDTSYWRDECARAHLLGCCGAIALDNVGDTTPTLFAALCAWFSRSLIQGTLASYQDVKCLKPYKPNHKSKFSVYNTNSSNWIMSWTSWFGRIKHLVKGLEFQSYDKEDNSWSLYTPRLLSGGRTLYSRNGRY
jgi:hypothetical protein